VTYQSASTLNTPSVTSGGTNSGYSNVTLTFSQVSGASSYYLYIKNSDGSTISRNITSEISLSGSTYTWSSSGKAIFSGYTGFPNSASTALGGSSASYQFYIQARNSYSVGVNSNTKTVTMPDNTSPNTVSAPTVTEEQDNEHIGKRNWMSASHRLKICRAG
jgi:hypothetical protein